MGGVVVDHDVQLAPRVGLGDVLEERQEFLVAMPRVAGVGHLAGGDLECGEQGGGAVPDVVVGLPFRVMPTFGVMPTGDVSCLVGVVPGLD